MAAAPPPARASGNDGGPAVVVVVMGVSGCGKTTVGAAVADALGAVFYEGDDFHSQANKAKMGETHRLAMYSHACSAASTCQALPVGSDVTDTLTQTHRSNTMHTLYCRSVQTCCTI